MDAARTLFIDGIGWWSPGLADWAAARLALRGEADPDDGRAASSPAALLLAANERRRAPDSVLLALEAAAQAVAAAGRHAADVASVFTSAHGDPAVTAALCRTLADDPRLLSPTRFHHSVHNAASGYWAIGSGSQAASTALSGGTRSFATGLLEAAVQCAADAEPRLLVACDTQADGALASVNPSRGRLALALLLAPCRTAASRWSLQWQLLAGAATIEPLQSATARALAANAMADALPLAEALASDTAATRMLALSDVLMLQLMLQPLAAPD